MTLFSVSINFSYGSETVYFVAETKEQALIRAKNLKFSPFHATGYSVKPLDFIDGYWISCQSELDISVSSLILKELHDSPSYKYYYANGISYESLYEKIKAEKPDLTYEKYEQGLTSSHLIFWNRLRGMVYPDPGGC